MEHKPTQIISVCPRDGYVATRARYDGTLMECAVCGYYPLVTQQPVTLAELDEPEVA